MHTKKRILSLLLAALLMTGMFPVSAFAAESDPVSGDISVHTAAELAALGGQAVEGNITLKADIDMTGVSMTPITSLKGCFNGDGKTISNLTLKGGSGSSNWQTGTVYVNTGLIGELDGSVINLKLSGVSIVEGIGNYNNVGALVGKIADGSQSKIENCTVQGTITSTGGSGYTLIGGLAGMMSGGIDAHTALTISNCVGDVALTGANSNYIGGLLGSAQYYSDVTIRKCAVLGSLSGKGNSGGVIGYINSASTSLSLSDSYLGGKVDGSKKFGISYNLSALNSLTCTNFYYDNEKNPSSGSWNTFEMLNKGGSSISSAVTGKTTAELKALKLDGFEVRSGEFDAYPVPVWTPAAAPDPIVPPAPPFSCALTFENTQGGKITVKDNEGIEITANEDGSYTLPATGEYTYAVSFDSDSIYESIPATAFTIAENDTARVIRVEPAYRTAEPAGEGTAQAPYQISNAAELRTFASHVNDGKQADAYVKLMADIIVPGSWTPLGKNAASPFRGHFDGDGHSVTITVDDPNLTYFGFFGCLDSKPERDSDVPMEDQPTVIVENLTVNGEIYCSEPSTFVGGIAARARGKVSIKNCVNNATISSLARASAGVGGLIGGYDDSVDYVWKNIRLTIENCVNNGLILVSGDNTNAMVGGLVGSNANCVQVANSRNTGTIQAPGATVGGLLGQAGYQTGDYRPEITDSANSGVLIGAPGKTNALYGKGVIGKDALTGSGDNAYTGGEEITDPLLLESQKYNDVLAVPADANVNDALTLLKSGAAADPSIELICLQGERDTNKAYLSCSDGSIRLAKRNETGKALEATATLKWTMDNRSLRRPVTVNIYPAAADPNTSARKALMDRIAAAYVNRSDDWVVFDMAAYEACGFGKNTTDRQNYLNLTIQELAGSSPLVTDRAKAEIILAALGVDSTRLTPLNGAEYSNAAKLAAMNLGSSHYAAPWVLLAEQAGQVKLTDAQRNSMIALLTDNLGADGLFVTKWGGETYADPDTTGTALAALAAYNTESYPQVQQFISRAVNGLSQAQRSNGSFGNVNSDAMVITGLAALGVDPSRDSRFVKGGCSLADALMLYVNDAKNGFTTGYISGAQGEKAQALATEQGFRALITLEQFSKDPSHAFNIYTLKSTSADLPDPTPVQPGAATDTGSVPSQGGSTGSGSSWMTVALNIKPDNSSAWYAGSVKTQQDATVQQVLETAASNAGLEMDIKDGYLRSVSHNGVTLGQFDLGPNSGWIYRVNGAYKNVGIDSYTVQNGDRIDLCYTADYTKESELDISKPSGGSGGSSGQTDQQAADAVVKLISAIGTVTKDSGDKITAARSAYDKLTEAQKKLVTNYKTLTDAETAFANLSKDELPFTDVNGHWAYDAIKYAYENSLFAGTSATTFGPNVSMNRAMLVTVLYRLDKEPSAETTSSFKDVPAGQWYTKAVAWASANKIVSGYSADTFGPTDTITREQMASILYRYAEYKGYNVSKTTDLAAFTDKAGVSDWALTSMQWANAEKLINGRTATTLVPQGNATRAEVAQILMTFAENVAK